jgi:hypothetical protein
VLAEASEPIAIIKKIPWRGHIGKHAGSHAIDNDLQLGRILAMKTAEVECK